jgi:hypothetical protein
MTKSRHQLIHLQVRGVWTDDGHGTLDAHAGMPDHLCTLDDDEDRDEGFSDLTLLYAFNLNFFFHFILCHVPYFCSTLHSFTFK